MTVTLHKPSLHKPTADGATRASMPGWSITADLTPPELKASRSLVVLRRYLAGGLALVLVLCVAGYLLAHHANSAAQAKVASATTDSVGIQATIDKHSGVTRVQAATAGIDSQLATLFAQDVDVPKLVAELTGAAGDGLQITSIDVSVTSSSATVDTETGATSIGTVTMAGSSQQLVDVAAYVDALETIRGVTDVIPSSNNAGGAWSLTLELTPVLATNRFAAAAATGTTPTTTTPTDTTSTTTSPTTTAGGN